MLTQDEIGASGHALSAAASRSANGDEGVVPLGRAEQAEIGRKLRDLYDEVATEPLPQYVADALTELEQKLREIKGDERP
ncbi:MAG: NepR family anti-sigma factor [Pseudomonadota bacterium]